VRVFCLVVMFATIFVGCCNLGGLSDVASDTTAVGGPVSTAEPSTPSGAAEPGSLAGGKPNQGLPAAEPQLSGPVGSAAVAGSKIQFDFAVTPDPEIFKRTPVIDGVISDGEWDIFYSTQSSGWNLATFANWDNGGLCFAGMSNVPVDFLILLDVRSDGWYHGDENYEFLVSRDSRDGTRLTGARYDSFNSLSPEPSVLSAAELSLVELRSKLNAESVAFEMRVPSVLLRRQLTAGTKVGVAIAVRTGSDSASWVPAGLVGERRKCSECILVKKKVAALKPIRVSLDLREDVVARGDELVGKFHLTNEGSEAADVRYFVIAGEGRTRPYINSERIRVDSLAPKRHISREFKTVIPVDMPLGAWGLGCEVGSTEARMGGVLVSFDVVDPYEVSLRLPEGEVHTDVKDITLGVIVRNNRRSRARGSVTINLPVGWELWKGAGRKEFSVPAGGMAPVSFKAKPPLGVAGRVPVSAEVSVEGRTIKAEGSLTLINP